MICSSVSAILPLVCAVDAISCAAFAFEPRRFAFERRQAVDLDQVLLPQLAHALELAVDRARSLCFFAACCAASPWISSRAGRRAGAVAPSGRRAPCAAARTACARRRSTTRHIGIVGALGSSRETSIVVGAVALGLERALCAPQLVEAFDDDRQVGAGHGIVETHDHVAGLDPVAVAHLEFADHAAGRDAALS